MGAGERGIQKAATKKLVEVHGNFWKAGVQVNEMLVRRPWHRWPHASFPVGTEEGKAPE